VRIVGNVEPISKDVLLAVGRQLLQTVSP
jgi:hypothetical protein